MSAPTLTSVCRRCAARAWLVVRLAEPAGRASESAGRSRRVCRHHCDYPREFASEPLAPDVIDVHGDIKRFGGLLGRDIVAFAGTRSPSDYGLHCAELLGREFATAAVTVASGDDELGKAARDSALQAGGETIAIGSQSASEPLAGQRTLALLADLLIVIEADEQAPSLAVVELAESRGAAIGAVPGRIDAAESCLSNRLITDGARVIGNAEYALDVLAGVGGRRRLGARKQNSSSSKTRVSAKPDPSAATAKTHKPRAPAPPDALELELDSRLAGVLERIRGGADTLAKLCLGARDCEGPALALTELELLGLLQRAPDGRYLPSSPGHLR